MLEDVRDIPGRCVLGHFDGPASVSRRVQEPLDLLLLPVGELVALGGEELDAVVLGRVVGGGEDDPEILREQCNRGRGKHSSAHGDPARGHDSLHDRTFEGRPRATRVTPHEDTAAAGPGSRCSPQALDEVEGQGVSDYAANAIGSEVNAGHG